MERRFNNNRSFGRSSNAKQVPVNVGEELDVKIEAVGEKGDGIAKRNGFVLFVPNTKAGDTVKIKVTKVFNKVGFAEVVGKADPSTVAQDVRQMKHPADEEEDDSVEDSEDFGDEEEDEE